VRNERGAAPDQAGRPAPGWASHLTERARSSPYYPTVRHPVFRRVLPGAALSALGDGMSAVAIAWLALELASPGTRGLWVGAAVAAYSLPGAAGAVVLRRWLRGRGGAGLVFVNAVLRAAALGLVGCLALAHLLGPGLYVTLLGVSSLLAAWGQAGKYTMIADLLPAEQRVAGNSVFGLADQLSFVIGPALAGLITALAGPATVITLDAASWVILAISYARVTPRRAPAPPPPPPPPSPHPPPAPAPLRSAPAQCRHARPGQHPAGAQP
jgi:DHA3 family macrolide efflux protein-like MFS transporter